MSDNVDNLVLEHLRGMRAGLERIEHELREIKTRVTSVEAGIAGIRRDSANDNDKLVNQQVGLDELKNRIERIEKRLELSAA